MIYKKQKNQKMCQKSQQYTNGTPAPPISQKQQNYQTNKSKEKYFIQKQQKIIQELMEKADHLEGTVSAMEAKLVVV